MAWSNANHKLAFRPLLAGSVIRARSRNVNGTLGAIALDDDDVAWLVTARHVLHIPGAAAIDRDPVFQGDDTNAVIAVTDAHRTSVELDVAAARIVDGVKVAGRALGIGRIGDVIAPEKGMAVVKSGLATGVTEGVIEEVDGSTVVIRTPTWAPIGYELTAINDSGALWLHRESHAAIAFHRKGVPTPGEMKSYAIDVRTTLRALRLTKLR